MGKYSIHEILSEGTQKFKGHEYIFERNGNTFEGVTYDRFAVDVQRTASALISMGLLGQNIIIIGGNSYNYTVADTAVMGYVGVSCTLSKEWSALDIINAAELLDAGAVIYSRQNEASINALREKFPKLTYIVLEELLQLKNESTSPLIPTDSCECCKIIFSSGTTGMPKAVMLSQDNMFANYENLCRRTPFTPQDKDYLFLPLSHTYGGICNFLYSLISGMSIYLCSDTKLILEELQMVKPTVFCAVPLIFEKLYYACTEGNIPPSAALGGNIRYLFCGGAYFRPEIRRYLKNAGLNLLEAYGLTETSSLISCEYTEPNDFESAGIIMENIEVRIDSPDENGTGEILVRGDNVFSGYFLNEAATVNAFDSEGFFRTGDLGFIKDGRLYLKGRKRRMILLSNGENVFPDEIEGLFTDYPQISRVKIFERDRRIHASFYAVSEVSCESIIDEVNEKLPKYARIQTYDIIADSIDTRLK
ncbi:MAG: long-chain fatty acid--CoA ligase [Ruminococcus sp.]|nr:long-chain fatty acid--CoA ligase [Ruminococcus sp.]